MVRAGIGTFQSSETCFASLWLQFFFQRFGSAIDDGDESGGVLDLAGCACRLRAPLRYVLSQSTHGKRSSQAHRELWSIWAGHLCVTICGAIALHILCQLDVDRTLEFFYPFWAAISSLVFFAKSGNFLVRLPVGWTCMVAHCRLPRVDRLGTDPIRLIGCDLPVLSSHVWTVRSLIANVMRRLY